MITLIARLCSVFIPMTLLRLCVNHNMRIKDLVFLSYGGLIRGAIAYALTFRIDKEVAKQYPLIRQNTLMIVLVTTIIFGSAMGKVGEWLGVAAPREERETSNE